MNIVEFLLLVTLATIGYFIYLPIYNYICSVLEIYKYMRFIKKNEKIERLIFYGITNAKTDKEIKTVRRLINKNKKLINKYRNEEYLSSYIESKKELLASATKTCDKLSYIMHINSILKDNISNEEM